jgi:hypothetical protein
MHKISTLHIHATGGTLARKRQNSQLGGTDDRGHQKLSRPVLMRFVGLSEDHTLNAPA